MGETGKTPALSQISMTTHSEFAERPLLGRLERGLLLSWSIMLVLCFALAASLNPDPRGYGTHEQLGLPACSFWELIGRPCPGCGMTTSISLFVRGRWIESARANVGGLALAAACLFQIPWAGYIAWTGRSPRRFPPASVAIWTCGLIFIIASLQWLPRFLGIL